METIFSQLHTLLTTPPGNLAYHLAITFAIVAALQAVFLSGREEARQPLSRVRLALVAVLIWHLTLFVLSGLAWQGVIDPVNQLPTVDRAVLVLSLVWIAWAWLFPTPHRVADSLLTLLTLAVLGLLLGTIRYPVTGATTFNHSYWDWIWSYTGAGLAALTLVALLVRQPAKWGTGFGFFTIAITGFIAHMVLEQPAQDFSSWIRISQLAIYPLLPALALRLRSSGDRGKVGGIHGVERSYIHELRALQSWLDLAERSPIARRNSQLLRALAYQMGADISLLVDFALDGETLIEAGYNALTEQDLTPILLRPNSLPVLSAFCLRERPLRLPVSGQPATDMSVLADMLHLEKTGSLLSIPLRLSDGRCASLILLSPYHPQRWTLEDQAILLSLSERFSQVMLPGEDAQSGFIQPEQAVGEADWQVEQPVDSEPARTKAQPEPRPEVNGQDLFHVLSHALASLQELLAKKDISLRLDAGDGLQLIAGEREQVEWLLWIHSALRRISESSPDHSTMTIQAGPLESLGDDPEIWLLISVQPPAGQNATQLGHFLSAFRHSLQPVIEVTNGRAQLKSLPGGEPALSVRIPSMAGEAR